MTEEFEEIEALNNRIYELYGELHENAPLMTEEQVEKIGKVLYDLYDSEYLHIDRQYGIDRKREVFEFKERSAAYSPRAWRVWFLHHENVPAKLIMENVDIEADDYFRQSESENDENRPDYMRKRYLSWRDKFAAWRRERRARRAERKKAARLRKLEKQRKPERKRERKGNHGKESKNA